MSRNTRSSINAYTAHEEWKRRPVDERYNSVYDLLLAARARRAHTVEYLTPARDLRVETIGSGLALVDAAGIPTALTHWSFGQLATIAGAPPDYLRRLPASLAAENLNCGLLHQERAHHKVYVDRATPRTALALNGPIYTRVHHDRLLDDLLERMATHPHWHLPLGYKNGEWGAERVPSGAYLGVHDLFVFLVDEHATLEEPEGSRQGQPSALHRGFIVRNSDVGATKLWLDLFLYRMVCGNHIIHGFQHVASFRRRHVGATIEEEWRTQLAAVTAALEADTVADRTFLQRAARLELGATRETVIDTALVRTELTKKQATDAFQLAEEHERNPRAVWGFVQGLTRLSQRTPWQDQRFALDRAASRLLSTAN